MTNQKPDSSPAFALVYVDADASSRRRFRNEMEANDVTNPVFYLSSGEELLERLAIGALNPYPGVILIALHLPGTLDGDDVIRRIREDFKHLDHSPLLLVTNESEQEADARAEPALADGWIGKPFTFWALMFVLRQKRRFQLTISDYAFERMRAATMLPASNPV